MPVLHEYLWLVVVGAFAAAGFGWGTGANDVANAFGTSVGSGTLTLRQAVIIAAIFEFAGALLLGRVSTNVIAGGIADIKAFQANPEVYAYGMCCALGVGTIWLIITSKMGLNVSSTHSIIGGIVGFSLVWAGKDGVIWAQKDGASFPPYKGLVSIIMAWFIAPILTGAVSAFFFFVIRTAILRRRNAYQLSFWLLPIAVLVTVWLNMYFVFTKGAKKSLSSSNWTDAKSAWISAVIAAGTAVLVSCFLLPLLKFWAGKKYDSDGKEIEQPNQARAMELADSARGPNGAIVTASDVANHKDLESNSDTSADPKADVAGTAVAADSQKRGFASKMWKAANHGLDVNIHNYVNKDERVKAIHMAAEKFEPRVEYAFRYLQVFSAICVIFAHGAGEVGYMAGPLATVWDVYQKGTLSKSVKPQIWIILIGALSLVIGLATYGYNVTRSMGVKLAKLTPTRGFAAELATAFVIMIAAQYGLPTSSSQCITGAIMGIGLMEGSGGVNWRQFGKQFASWVSTLFVVGLGVGALFAQGVYSPSKIDSTMTLAYKNQVSALSTAVYKDFNTTLYSYRNASISNAIPTLTPAQFSLLNATIANGAKSVSTLKDPTKGVARPEAVLKALYGALNVVQNNTVSTLGQITIFPNATQCNTNNTQLLLAGNAAPVQCKAPKIAPPTLKV